MATATGAPPTDQTLRVRQLASQVADRTAERDRAIVAAHSDGATIAALARAADIDVGTVRRILARTA